MSHIILISNNLVWMKYLKNRALFVDSVPTESKYIFGFGIGFETETDPTSIFDLLLAWWPTDADAVPAYACTVKIRLIQQAMLGFGLSLAKISEYINSKMFIQ